jgi:hypothetical protein
MPVPTEDKDEDVKVKLYVELEHNFNQFHRNHMKNVIKSRNQGTSYLVKAALWKKSPVSECVYFPQVYEHWMDVENITQQLSNNDLTVYIIN